MNKDKISRLTRTLVLKEHEIQEYLSDNYLSLEEREGLMNVVSNIEITLVNLTHYLSLEQDTFNKEANNIIEQIDYTENLLYSLN